MAFFSAKLSLCSSDHPEAVFLPFVVAAAYPVQGITVLVVGLWCPWEDVNSGSSCVTILNPPSVTLYCLYGTDYKGVLILQLSGPKLSRKLPLSSVSFVIFMI